MAEPFFFKTSLRLIQMLGIKARNLTELLEGIRMVPLSSIYYHTHRLLYQQLALYPEPPNDFAYWICNSLNIKELSESVASINIIRFDDIEELRNQFFNIINDYNMKERPVSIAPEGQEFHFMNCQTFVLPTPYIANNIKEFFEALKMVSINSLYFHLIESRLRLRKGENDFSRWLRNIGAEKSAIEIEKLDPYTITLEGLRRNLLAKIKKYASD
ncbi:MAG: DUF5752 family protein [candidate division WOR-3 bacterium]